MWPDLRKPGLLRKNSKWSYYNQWIERFVSFRMIYDTCKLTVAITQGKPLNLINP